VQALGRIYHSDSRHGRRPYSLRWASSSYVKVVDNGVLEIDMIFLLSHEDNGKVTVCPPSAWNLTVVDLPVGFELLLWQPLFKRHQPTINQFLNFSRVAVLTLFVVLPLNPPTIPHHASHYLSLHHPLSSSLFHRLLIHP
jgi:hypothetical protein